jgi:coatomer subunit beta
VMSLYSIFVNVGPELVEDSTDTIESILINESDISTKRNAFLLLFHLE